MPEQTIQQELWQRVINTSQEGWGYFCHSENWCDVADQDELPCDCEQCNIDFHGDDYDPEYDDPAVCECGNCSVHTGGVLSVEYLIASDGGFLGAIVCVTSGGPRIVLETRSKQIIGYWAACGDVCVNYPDNESVADFWEQNYNEMIQR